MASQRWIPCRLKLSDVQALINGHQQIAAVVSALRKTNWAGAETAIAALAPLDQWIADLYNRAEPFWLRYLQSGNRMITDGEVATPNVDTPEPSLVAMTASKSG
jgi:hypothetical protein